MRILPPFVLALGLFFSLMLLFPRGAPATVHAQSVAEATITTTQSNTITSSAADAAYDLYLPLIHRGPDNPPTPTPSPTPPPIKERSGIHLGNRGSSDWRAELFTLITGTVTGTWPAAVVVQSNQLYNFSRPSTPSNEECRVNSASVKLTGEGEPYNAFKYLTAAIKAGTKVVIRINPSPGNFLDWANPGDNHRLRIDIGPAGGNYCDERAEDGPSTDDKIHDYRDILDIAQEMNAIYTLVVGTYKWPAENLFFEPANEPNQEWYQSYVERGIANLDPKINNKQAWIDMDDYFAVLYDQAKQLQPELQILAPSMSQGLHGEHYPLGSCDNKEMVVIGENERTGLDFMKKTFGYDPEAADPDPDPKADGFAWHNYWSKGQETWLPPFHGGNSAPTVDDYCDVSIAYRPQTDHFFQYLSDGMQQSMSILPTFITEADLKSPCQQGEAGAAESKDATAEAISNSLHTFITQETEAYVNTGYGAQYVIAWLLTNQYANEEENCRVGGDPLAGGNPNYEQNWHEAYREDGAERTWFRLWWPATP